jgi:hypothetical protein
MSCVKMLPEVVSADRAVADRWYVSNGATAVGPVNLELLARGIEAGKVPMESFVRHEAWRVWRPLSELVDTEGSAVRRIPPPPSTDDITLPGRPLRPDDLTGGDGLLSAADIYDALLLLLGAAVRRVAAEAALILEVRDEHAIVMCAHGTRLRDVLGQRIWLNDPVLVAARAGHAVLAEPSPGPAGLALLQRLAQLGMTGEGGFMLPIRPGGRLFAVLEIGRRVPFRAGEIATIEGLIKTVEQKADAEGWLFRRAAPSAEIA